MGSLRKDPTKKGTTGRGKGLTVKGKVRTQDGTRKATKPWGQR